MKILSITGIHSNDIQSLLSHLDMSDPKKTSSNAQFDQEISSFHRQVLLTLGSDIDGLGHIKEPEIGEMRVQQAIQMLLSHSQSRLLAWADPSTILLLDFWKKIEPQIKYLLIYQPPWVAIDHLFSTFPVKFEDDPMSAALLWLDYNKKLLQFYNSNKKNCLMINSYFLTDTYEDLRRQFMEKFDLQLLLKSSEKVSSATNRLPDRSILYLLNQNMPELLDLYLEMESQANLLGREADLGWQDQLQIIPKKEDVFASWIRNIRISASEKSIRANYSATKNRLEEKTLLSDKLQSELLKHKQLVKANQENKQEILSLKRRIIDYQRQKDKLESSLKEAQESNSFLEKEQQQIVEKLTKKSKYQEKVNKLTQSLNDANAELDKKNLEIKRYQQEEELSLLQLHQVQEELEYYFLMQQDSQKLLQDYTNSMQQAQKIMIKLAQAGMETKL